MSRIPPSGISPTGVIVIDINFTSLAVKEVDMGDYAVNLHLRSKVDGFEWIFVTVYGAAQDSQNQNF